MAATSICSQFALLGMIFSAIDAARISQFEMLSHDEVESISFDFSIPSCDASSLSAADLETAVDVKKSGSGNMGGVYFLTLSGPNCNVVVKPRLDLHDAFASALGTELGMPVAKTKLLTEAATPDEWSSLVKSFKNLNSDEGFLTTVAEGSGFVQIMGVAEGKDLYEMTGDTLGWEACRECLGGQMKEGIRKGLKADDDADMLEKIAAKLGGKRLDRDFRELCKLVWTHVSTDADKAGKFWTKDKPPRFCPTSWRQSEEFVEDLRAYYADNSEAVDEELAFAYANTARRNVNTYCPASMKPNATASRDAKTYVQSVMNSALTRAEMTSLSAFESLICENDGMNAFGFYTSNYHNVFFSDKHATGIDMAVGGALYHNEIQPGAEPEELMNSKIAFNYKDIEDATRLGTCGTDAEVAAMAETKFTGKMLRPYVGDREMNYQICARDKGHTGPLAPYVSHGIEIVKAWPAAMKFIIDSSDDAIATVTQEIEGLDDKLTPLANAIKDFLEYHLVNLRESYDKGIKACEE